MLSSVVTAEGRHSRRPTVRIVRPRLDLLKLAGARAPPRGAFVLFYWREARRAAGGGHRALCSLLLAAFTSILSKGG
ncbi:hypothetical protein EVAR_44728_1 [Eumeta japonica]|uniref:Uncharacterized protein n=1 Tax=Eumeta variegata TaxID=151549 RepID=A0A4C1XJK8_EUMVA|nr:hypothetical protein EVAR_44728_1 [Eumeta japonica]